MSAQLRIDRVSPPAAAAERAAPQAGSLAAGLDASRPAATYPAEVPKPGQRPGEAPSPVLPPGEARRGATGAAWRLESFAGRLAEISGGRASSALTLAFRLAWEAQRQGEPVAWVGRRERAFFPPDAAEAGVDLDGLVAVWAPGAIAVARAADLLVRSGAFGLVVLDLGEAAALPPAALARLAGLALKHRTAMLCLTEKEPGRPSLGPLVSMRAEADRSRRPEGRFLCRARVVKDKRCGPGWEYEEICRGPDGLS